MDKVRVQLCFTTEVDIKGQKINYSDAFYFTQEDYAKLDEKQLDKMKAERILNWVEAINNPPAEVEPSKEQLEAESVSLAEQKQQIDTRIAELQEKITVMSVRPIKDAPLFRTLETPYEE